MGDEEAKWKDVWNLYDTERTGKIKKEDFLDCVRVCTRRYPMSVLQQKTKDMGAAVSYESFFDFMMEPYTGPNQQDLLNALKAFDGKEVGELTVAQISMLLTQMGDKLNPADVKPIMDLMPQNGGKVKISDLVQFLTPPVPTAKPDIDELLRELVREEAAKMNFADGEPEISDEINEEFDRRKAEAAAKASDEDDDPMKFDGDDMQSEGSSDDAPGSDQ